MFLPVNRQLKRIFLLACAVLMLALPVADSLDHHEAGNFGPAQQLAFNASADRIQETSLPQTGLAHTGTKLLKPNEFFYGTISQSHAAGKAIPGEKQSVSLLSFSHALQNNPIQLHASHFCAPVSCRAPPSFSAFQYRI